MATNPALLRPGGRLEDLPDVLTVAEAVTLLCVSLGLMRAVINRNEIHHCGWVAGS